MKHLRKLLSAALVAALMLAILIAPVSAEEEVVNEVVGGRFNGMPWQYDTDNRALAINGQGQLPADSPKPWQNYEEEVETVVFRPGITGIPDGFMNYCINMTTIMIPASVTYIGEGVFTISPKLTDIVYEGDPEMLKNIRMSEADLAVIDKVRVHEGTITDNSEPNNPRYTYVYGETTVTVGGVEYTIATKTSKDESWSRATMGDKWIEDGLIRTWKDENGATHKLYSHEDNIYGKGTKERIIYSKTKETNITTYDEAGLTITEDRDGDTSVWHYEYSNPDAEYKSETIVEQNGVITHRETVMQDGSSVTEELEDEIIKEQTYKDADGNVTAEISLDNDGEIVKETDYNPDGSKVEYINENANGNPQYTYYDADGNKTERIEDLGDGGIRKYTFTDDTNFTMETVQASGRVITTDVIDGNIARQTIYYEDGTALIIDYDNDGNVKRYITFDADGNVTGDYVFQAAELNQEESGAAAEVPEAEAALEEDANGEDREAVEDEIDVSEQADDQEAETEDDTADEKDQEAEADDGAAGEEGQDAEESDGESPSEESPSNESQSSDSGASESQPTHAESAHASESPEGAYESSGTVEVDIPEAA